MPAKPKATKATAADVYDALAQRYERGRWVCIQEAPQANLGGRRCDFIAVGVWQTTKNEIIGHEVKVSRSDWLNELQQPQKSEAFIPYCNRWYIVALQGIVKLPELRSNWGLMELVGENLRIRRQAERTESIMPDRNMLAAWLRRVSEGAINAQMRQIEKRVIASIDSAGEYEREGLKREIERLRERIANFEEAAGIRIDNWSYGKVGAVVRMLTSCDIDPNYFKELAKQHAANARRAAEAFKQLKQVQKTHAKTNKAGHEEEVGGTEAP